MPIEEVILVNELDQALGTMEKMAAHEQALLHRAFSVFIVNNAGEMLLQQRAFDKYHCGGLWTNACCSHPRPAEDTAAAAQRRLQEELGFETPLEKIFDFVYRAPFSNGLTEHEFDHVYLGVYNGALFPAPAEVAHTRWMRPEQIQQEMKAHPEAFTPWFHLAFERVCDWQDRKRLETIQ
jgi:isopentenyl-diphosphate delta-isomerase